MSFTDEELAMLTDEERASLQEDEQIGELGSQEESLPPEAVAEAPVLPEETETAVSPQPEETAEFDEKPLNLQPLFNTVNVPEVQARLSQLDADKEALLTQFDEGELDGSQYQRALDAQLDERINLKLMLQRAELAEEARVNEATRRWQEDVNDFLGEHPDIADHPVRYSALDAVLRQLTQEEASQALSNRRILQLAYQRYCDAFGVGQVPPVMAEEPPVTPVVSPASTRTGEAEVPPTLGKIPSAVMNDTDEGRFALLDRLAESDPLGYEARLAAMPDEEQERYLAGA